MPLMSGKSEKAFSHNVSTEMHHGRPQDQALAIAYRMKRKAQKMAKGGFAHEEKASGYQAMPMAEGGYMDDCYQDDGDCLDMVGRIMAKRQSRYAHGGSVDSDQADQPTKVTGSYSRGGQVANAEHGMDDDDLAGFSPAEYDDLVLRADDMEGADYTGANSGDELGNAQEDEDQRDIVSRIMRSRRMKDRNPRDIPA